VVAILSNEPIRMKRSLLLGVGVANVVWQIIAV